MRSVRVTSSRGGVWVRQGSPCECESVTLPMPAHDLGQVTFRLSDKVLRRPAPEGSIDSESSKIQGVLLHVLQVISRSRSGCSGRGS